MDAHHGRPGNRKGLYCELGAEEVRWLEGGGREQRLGGAVRRQRGRPLVQSRCLKEESLQVRLVMKSPQHFNTFCMDPSLHFPDDFNNVTAPSEYIEQETEI